MRSVHVSTGSRLHFGMLSFGQRQVRRFGGLGVMVREPSVRLAIRPAESFCVAGEPSERVAVCVARLVQAGWFATAPACQIEVLSAPPAHVGLGSGTQLALAVARGLHAWSNGPPLTPAELARACGRGVRSALGVHGFAQGGMLLEAGKLADDEISPLVARVDFPTAWRFVLCSPRGELGIHGEAEAQAFEQLPPVPLDISAELSRLAVMELFPSAALADCSRFSAALLDFGHLAGSCFASQQAGAYASSRVARLIDWLQGLGVEGVAQSSWGPTVAALFADEAAAQAFVEQQRGQNEAADLSFRVVAPLNAPAACSIE